MNRARVWSINAFVAAATLWFPPPALISQQQPAAKPKVDLGSFTKEIMVLNVEGDQRQLAMWFPFEFFVEANLAGAGKNRAEVERQLRFLKPFHTVIVQCGLDKEDGSTAYANLKDVRARAVLKPDKAEAIPPLEKVPPLVAATVEAMKTAMAAEGDEGGSNMHVLLFPAATKDGRPIVDISKKGKLTLLLKADGRFKETVLVWHTPFDAMTPAPPCPKCAELISAKWSYCPWCGSNLEKEQVGRSKR
jgi:hypothetical protein